MSLKDGYVLKGNTYKGAVLAKKAAGIYQQLGDKKMEAKSNLTLAKVEVAGNDATKAGKELMDGAAHSKLVEDINVTLSHATDYMHIPASLVVDPGMTKRIQGRYNEAVS